MNDYCCKCDSAKGFGDCKACKAFADKRRAYHKRLDAAALEMYKHLKKWAQRSFAEPMSAQEGQAICALIAKIEGE